MELWKLPLSDACSSASWGHTGTRAHGRVLAEALWFYHRTDSSFQGRVTLLVWGSFLESTSSILPNEFTLWNPSLYLTMNPGQSNHKKTWEQERTITIPCEKWKLSHSRELYSYVGTSSQTFNITTHSQPLKPPMPWQKQKLSYRDPSTTHGR